MRRGLVPLAALVWGMQYAFLLPVVGLLLVNLYGASPADVGWALMVYNIAGFVSSLILPTWADRRREYLVPMLTAGVLTVALALSLWAVSSLTLAVAALVVLGGPAGMGAGLLFAHMRHASYKREQIVNTRSFVAFAWIAGPPIATFIMGTFGDRAVLPTLAVLGLGNIAVTLLMIREHRALTDDPRARQAEPAAPTAWATVIVVAAAMVLVQATNVAMVSVLGLYVVDQLGFDLRWAGVALGVSAAIEVPMLWGVGRLSRRISSIALLVAGTLSGVLFYVALALVDTIVWLVAIQVLNAFFFAVVGGISLTWFQDVLPRPGLAATISGNVRRLGGVVAGPVVAVAGFTALGYTAVWWLCAALAAVAVVMMVLVDRRGRRSPAPA